MIKNIIKNKKGITMISLIIYVASFLTVTLVIGYITTFFYNNVNVINSSAGMAADYNTVLACLKKEASLTGSVDAIKNKFVKVGTILYYKPNSGKVIAIAKNVGKNSADWSLEKIDTSSLEDGDPRKENIQMQMTIVLNGIHYSNIFTLLSSI